jgi:hypothetical protein
MVYPKVTEISREQLQKTLPKGYEIVGPKVLRKIWELLIDASTAMRGPCIAEIEPTGYYIAVIPPAPSVELKSIAVTNMMKIFNERTGNKPVFSLSLTGALKGGDISEPYSKWLPLERLKLLDEKGFETAIYLRKDFFVEYAKRIITELGGVIESQSDSSVARRVEIVKETIKNDSRWTPDSFLYYSILNVEGIINLDDLVLKMAYGGYTKEYLAAILYTSGGKERIDKETFGGKKIKIERIEFKSGETMKDELEVSSPKRRIFLTAE